MVDAPLTSTQRSRNQLIAALVGVLSSFLMSCMALTAKLATQRGASLMLVMAARGVLSWLFAFVLLVMRNAPREDYIGARSAWCLLTGRVVVGSIALFLFLAGVSVMPIGDATALFLTNQIWTIALARICFTEPLRLAHAIGLGLALPGALLVVQPPAIFGGSASAAHAAYYSPLAPLLPLLSAVGAAGAYVAVQACSRAGVPRSAIVHCFSAGSALLGGAAMFIAGERPLVDTFGMLLLCLCGIFGFLAQTCLTFSIALDSATTFSIAMLSEVAFAFVWDLLVFGTRASALTLVGAALLSLGVVAALAGKAPAPGRSCCARLRYDDLRRSSSEVEPVGKT